MDAFDSDVLIYAADPHHSYRACVLALLPDEGSLRPGSACTGSMLLIPELLTKPTRENREAEFDALASLLTRLDLLAVEDAIANLAVELGARYRLKAADAVHLATAVSVGADRFITNNQGDFRREITEIDVTYPADLPDPARFDPL